MLVPLNWNGENLEILDQRLLPMKVEVIEARSMEDVISAIGNMAVRGAPAIGIAGAFALAFAIRSGSEPALSAEQIISVRPTAVNLSWAVNRVLNLPNLDWKTARDEALKIQAEDLEMNRKIGANGLELIGQGARILTICNTGALATGGHGTALGIIRTAHSEGKNPFVYSCETRPRLQGLRLTSFELAFEKIPFASLADSAAASLMKSGKIDLALVGADRIAKNGDTANKIGTYMLAVLCQFHGIPFYVAAPTSTFDLGTADGNAIPIEERASSEITEIDGVEIAPNSTPVYNPAFDVTPGNLISAIISERGIHRPPYEFA